MTVPQRHEYFVFNKLLYYVLESADGDLLVEQCDTEETTWIMKDLAEEMEVDIVRVCAS